LSFWLSLMPFATAWMDENHFAAVAIPLAFVHQLLADALYVTVSLMWLIPDRRMERMLAVGAHDADRSTS
jgi:uncharacterized membrane protein